MLTIIAGKPGQGKSYHMTMLLVDMLTEWVRYELRNNGEPYDSSIWINIVLKEEGLNKTISERVGQEVDVWKYINFCDKDFFNDPQCTYWWAKFPDKAVIVIDEVHKYLGKKVEYGSLDLETELVNWISTHRHTKQEIYFLSQHTDQFAKPILGVADGLLEIVNLKSLTLSFPVSLPMADVYELREAFGIKTQYYQANVGNFRGKAVRWGEASYRHLMSDSIFRCYASHASGIAADRPPLNRTPWEGIVWFTRKHGWHLIPKFVFAVSLPFVVMYTVIALPAVLMAAVESGGTPVANDPPEPPAVIKTETPPPLPAVRQPETPPLPAPVAPAIPVERVKFSMLFNGGIILDDGRKIAIGETMGYAGETETLAAACAVCGIIIFESGKRIRF